jgi:hypothetical protein
MAAISAMPPQINGDDIRRACSHPKFITTIYDMINTLSEYRIVTDEEQERSEKGYLPPHTTTLIGGAAFILHVYQQNGQDMRQMQGVPQTSDIDIAIWYNNVIENAAEFTAKNRLMESNIRMLFGEQSVIETFRREMLKFIPSAMKTFTIEVPPSKTHSNLTTTIHINFIINGQRFEVVDVAMKNAIYSQRVRPGTNRRTFQLNQNITHTNHANTTILTLFNKKVRVPTLERLIQQQQFAIDMKREDDPAQLSKYQARINYLRQHSELGSPAALDTVRTRFARAEQNTHAMMASLSRPASLSRNSGRPPLAPRRGGKCRTYRKNKRHTKRRHTKRN